MSPMHNLHAPADGRRSYTDPLDSHHNLHAPADGRQAAFALIGVNLLNHPAHLPRPLRVQAARCLRDVLDGESPALGDHRRLHNPARSLEREHPGAAASNRSVTVDE